MTASTALNTFMDINISNTGCYHQWHYINLPREKFIDDAILFMCSAAIEQRFHHHKDDNSNKCFFLPCFHHDDDEGFAINMSKKGEAIALNHEFHHTIFCTKCKVLFLRKSDNLSTFEDFLNTFCPKEFSPYDIEQCQHQKNGKILSFSQKMANSYRLQNLSVALYQLFRDPLTLKKFMNDIDLFGRLVSMLFNLLEFWLVEYASIKDLNIKTNDSESESHYIECGISSISRFASKFIQYYMHIMICFAKRCRSKHIRWIMQSSYFWLLFGDDYEYNVFSNKFLTQCSQTLALGIHSFKLCLLLKVCKKKNFVLLLKLCKKNNIWVHKLKDCFKNIQSNVLVSKIKLNIGQIYCHNKLKMIHCNYLKCYKSYCKQRYGVEWEELTQTQQRKVIDSSEVILNRMYICSGCKLVYYCGRHCQKKDWRHHKRICLT